MFVTFQEAIATSDEVGRDLEHVEVLQKKFEDFLKDIQANESRVTYINDLAHQLGDEGHPDIELISTKQTVRNIITTSQCNTSPECAVFFIFD